MEEERQKELERQQEEVNKQLNQELKEHNVLQRTMKDNIFRAEKEKDKEMVSSIVTKEKMLDQLEKEIKVRVNIYVY